jgi:hypothetical protein
LHGSSYFQARAIQQKVDEGVLEIPHVRSDGVVAYVGVQDALEGRAQLEKTILRDNGTCASTAKTNT